MEQMKTFSSPAPATSTPSHPAAAAPGSDHPDPVSAAPGSAASAAPPTAAEAAPNGRPSTFTPTKLHAVCQYIQVTGFSDTYAAALAGVTRSTISRWKKDNEEVEMELTRARAQWLLPRLTSIGQTRRKDGELDWRAQAWLVKFAAPEEFGPPSRRRRLQDVEVPTPPTEAEKAAMAAEAEAKEMEIGVQGWLIHEPGGVISVPM